MAGRLIVIEGIDGAGKTTQVAKLYAALVRRGFAAATLAQPSQRPAGRLIRSVLAEVERTSPGATGTLGPTSRPWTPSEAVLGLLFAADRLDQAQTGLAAALAADTVVLMDRYYHSSVAYQGTARDDGTVPAERAWLREINRNAPRADAVVVLDVDPAWAATRRKSRAGIRERYDSAEFQQRVAAFYADLAAHFPDDRVVSVRADREADDVHRDVLAAVEDALPPRREPRTPRSSGGTP